MSRSVTLSRPVRRTLVRAVYALVIAWIGAYEIHVIAAPNTGVHGVFSKQVHLVALVLATLACLARAAGDRTERRAWLLVALGIGAWTAGEIYYTQVLWDMDEIPVPSAADVGYLLLCPLWFAGFGIIARHRVKGTTKTVWIDGLCAALAVGAVGAAVVFEPVAHAAEGRPAAVATNLAYPIFDLVIVAMLVAVMTLRGWRFDRTFALLGAGVLSFWVADSVYLVQTANGTYTTGGPWDMGWWLGLTLISLAAWQPASAARSARRDATLTIVMPVAFAALAVAVLGFGALRGHHIGPLAVGLACGSLAMVLLRLVVTFRAHSEMLRASRHEARNDVLTGLPNRRALQLDLDEALADGGEAALVLFDLDGFKHYNDSFGHQAGDALLVRLGAALQRDLGARGSAYRMGGDEFCALLRPNGAQLTPLVERAATALSEHGEGFSVTSSWGAVVLGAEAADPEEALRLADQRMYARKRSGRSSSVGRQTTDVLLRALAERHPDLDGHSCDVALLAEATAQRLGLEPDDVEAVRQAAQLHDIGKVAIPETILHKPGALDEDEWRFMRRHSEIGERIIAEAPSLSRVAAMVRASHERFDGAGYPDGLRGSEIPLGARIVCVCDAYSAMISERAYSPALTPQAAERELRDCAGSQFDPAVVEAFCAVRATTPHLRAVA
jgi:diguanylate cyclase (GGDEF)-like protein/putative nucleotidyltransferase with HDIG domain